MAEAGWVVEVRRLLVALQATALQPTPLSFSFLLKAYSQARQPKLAEAMLYNELPSPSVAHYTAVINAYAATAAVGDAHRVLSTMQAKGLQPSAYTWSALAKAYLLSGDAACAEQLVRRVVRGGEKPSVVLLTQLLQALFQQQRPQAAASLHRLCQRQGVVLDSTACMALIRGYSGAAMWREVAGVMRSMQAEGVPWPGPHAFHGAMFSLCEKGQMASAAELLRWLQRTGREKPTAWTHNILLKGCARLGMGKAAMAALEEMERNEVAPNTLSFNLVRGKRRTGQASSFHAA